MYKENIWWCIFGVSEWFFTSVCDLPATWPHPDYPKWFHTYFAVIEIHDQAVCYDNEEKLDSACRDELWFSLYLDFFLLPSPSTLK